MRFNSWLFVHVQLHILQHSLHASPDACDQGLLSICIAVAGAALESSSKLRGATAFPRTSVSPESFLTQSMCLQLHPKRSSLSAPSRTWQSTPSATA